VKDGHAINLFDKVKETTVGLDKMLTKLQAISAIDYETSGKVVAVSDLIGQSLEKFASSIEAKGIKAIVENDADKIRTSVSHCRIFLDNIIENSIDFCTPINPTLRISSNQSGDNLIIIIEDNGQGISAAIQHRIFEMYFRGNDNSRGNGLGLYIAKRAIDKLGGTISFISRLNEGTSFKITIPSMS
jgi:signal transduction histidine kinase